MPGEKTASHTLYEELVDITHEYLGPAADRYVARQIEGHLHKAPEEVRKKDLKELINWIRIATNHLIDDEELVNEYVARLQKLRAPSRRKASS